VWPCRVRWISQLHAAQRTPSTRNVAEAAPRASRLTSPRCTASRSKALQTSVLAESPDASGESLLRALEESTALLCAEMAGGMEKVLETAVDYANERYQFGRPIGSFQAIKHKCADMLLEVESAKSAAYYGLWCASEMNDELPSVASLAKAYCSEAYFHATAENIQIHGGIGFTWEHPAHLYFKRAKSSELMFGDPTYHREQLAQRIGI